MMDEEVYMTTQKSIELIESLNAGLDLDAFLARISRAHALGPILDPTLYQRAMENLQHIEAAARKLRELQEITKPFAEKQRAARGEETR